MDGQTQFLFVCFLVIALVAAWDRLCWLDGVLAEREAARQQRRDRESGLFGHTDDDPTY